MCAMARNTITPTLEAIHAEVPTRNAGAVGEELAASFNSEKATNFDACRIAHAAIVESGLGAEDVAKATTRALANLMFPSDASKRKWAETTPRNKGGASITRVAITQRKDAYADVIEAGITPTPDTVDWAYKLATTGGSKDARTRVVVAVKKAAPAKREVTFINKASTELITLRKANAEKSSANAAGKSADDKAESPSEESPRTVLEETVEEVSAYLRAQATRDWSPAEKKALLPALRELAKRLS